SGGPLLIGGAVAGIANSTYSLCIQLGEKFGNEKIDVFVDLSNEKARVFLESLKAAGVPIQFVQ
ncbi:MAG: hypothetical protein ABL958_09155, partial [Bdellovibrionia bacterium]